MPTLAEIKTEIVTDPAGIGYATVLNGELTPWHELTALLNAPRTASPLPRGVVPAYMVAAAVDRAEFDALAAAGRTYLSLLLQPGQVDLSAAPIRAGLGALFPAGSTTRTRLIALADRDASRAEVLWGAGTVIDFMQVVLAMREG